MTFTNLEIELFCYAIPIMFSLYLFFKFFAGEVGLTEILVIFSGSYFILFFFSDFYELFSKNQSNIWATYTALAYIFLFSLIFGKSKTVITI